MLQKLRGDVRCRHDEVTLMTMLLCFGKHRIFMVKEILNEPLLNQSA